VFEAGATAALALDELDDPIVKLLTVAFESKKIACTRCASGARVALV
jgi:hypothetical protein